MIKSYLWQCFDEKSPVDRSGSGFQDFYIFHDCTLRYELLLNDLFFVTFIGMDDTFFFDPSETCKFF